MIYAPLSELDLYMWRHGAQTYGDPVTEVWNPHAKLFSFFIVFIMYDNQKQYVCLHDLSAIY